MDADVFLFLGFVLHVGITIASLLLWPHRHNYDHAQMETTLFESNHGFTCAIIFDNLT
jgi:hypothetical protein